MNYGLRSLLLCAMLVSLSVGAESVLDMVPTLDSISQRLELTPEQQARLRPLFERRLSELQASQLLLQNATTQQQKEDVLRDMKKAGDDFNSQFEKVLTPSQKNEWHDIRSGLRENIQERAEQKRE